MPSIDLNEMIDFLCLWGDRMDRHMVQHNWGYTTDDGQKFMGCSPVTFKHVFECLTKTLIEAEDPVFVMKALDLLMTSFEKIQNTPNFPSTYLEKKSEKWHLEASTFTDSLLSDLNKMVQNRKNIAQMFDQVIADTQSNSTPKAKM